MEKGGQWQPVDGLQGQAKGFGHCAVATRGHAELLGGGQVCSLYTSVAPVSARH